MLFRRENVVSERKCCFVEKMLFRREIVEKPNPTRRLSQNTQAMRHVKVDYLEEQVPVISVDYCFMNSKDDTVIIDDIQSKYSPVLVVRDRWTKMIFAHVLPYKGVQRGPVGSKCFWVI